MLKLWNCTKAHMSFSTTFIFILYYHASIYSNKTKFWYNHFNIQAFYDEDLITFAKSFIIHLPGYIIFYFLIINSKMSELHNQAWVIFHNTHFHPLPACFSVFKQNRVLIKIIQHSRFLWYRNNCAQKSLIDTPKWSKNYFKYFFHN